MRKLTSILLFGCLCLMLAGSHLVFHFQRMALKKEMKSSLLSMKNTKGLVEISFTKEELARLEWEGDQEFRYNGEMYDVIKRQRKRDNIVILCFPDKKETALLNEYQKNNKHSSTNSTIVQLMTTQFVSPVCDFPNQPEKILENHFKDSSSQLQNFASPVLLPPPDIS